jgi:AcrR family transcriptional regulator
MATARPSTGKRPYRMGVRAEQVAATREHMLATAMQLFSTRLYDEVSLDDVAAGAGTTVQTVIRHFGSKDSLFGWSRLARRRGRAT